MKWQNQKLKHIKEKEKMYLFGCVVYIEKDSAMSATKK